MDKRSSESRKRQRDASVEEHEKEAKIRTEEEIEAQPITVTESPSAVVIAAPVPASSSGERRSRITWTDELKAKFVTAYQKLGSSARPKAIWMEMREPGLTISQVSSHLQKYRLKLSKEADEGDDGHEYPLPSADETSAAETLRSPIPEWTEGTFKGFKAPNNSSGSSAEEPEGEHEGEPEGEEPASEDEESA